MSNEDLIFFYCLLSLIARLSTRQRRVADLGGAAKAKAAVCGNGGSVRFDGVLQLDDFLRSEAIVCARLAQHPLEAGAAADDARAGLGDALGCGGGLCWHDWFRGRGQRAQALIALCSVMMMMTSR